MMPQSHCSCGSPMPDLHSSGCAAPLIDQLRAELAAVTADRDAWRAAMGRFGPQSPAEVAVFEQEATRVDAEVSAHEIALAVAAVKDELETVGASRFDAEVALEQEKREHARVIAFWKAEELDWITERAAHAETRETLETKLREAGREIAQMASTWSKEVTALQARIAELEHVTKERDALKLALETALRGQP